MRHFFDFVHRTRVELVTPSFVGWCSIQLSYRCIYLGSETPLGLSYRCVLNH